MDDWITCNFNKRFIIDFFSIFFLLCVFFVRPELCPLFAPNEAVFGENVQQFREFLMPNRNYRINQA